MFKSARIKLTLWYLLIIMTVSLSFSGLVYRVVTSEFQSRFDAIERRLYLQERGLVPPGGRVELFVEDLSEAKQRVFWVLLYVNGVILVFSAFAGYFLAGRTLSPIEMVVEEQKRFVADASHELKTPLTALQTSIEVALRDRKIKLKEAKNVLKESLNDVESLKTLANSLLSLARYQQGNNNFVKETVDLGKLAKTVYKKMAPLAKEKKIKMSLEVGKAEVLANKEELEKLMTILVDNAVKYTPRHGEVILSTKKERRCVVLKIKDTGVGMPKGEVAHIFDRFYRVDQSRSKEGVPGFGLGLSIAKKIVDWHKGSIRVASAPGKGSTFTVRLPTGYF